MSEHERITEMLARRPELTPAEEAGLREHLASCPACRQTAEAYRQQTALLRSLPQVDPPSALRAAVLAEIRRPRPVRTWQSRWPLLLGPVAAALVIGLAALLAVHQPQRRQAINHRPSPTVMPTATPRRVTGVVPKRHHPAPPLPHPQHAAHPFVRPSARPALRPTSLPAPPTATAAPELPQQAPVLSQALPTPTPAPAPPAPAPTAFVPPSQPPAAARPAAGTSQPLSAGGVGRVTHAAPAYPTPTPTPGSTPLPFATPIGGAPAVGAGAVHPTPTPAPVGEIAPAAPVLPASPPRRPMPSLPVVIPTPYPTPTP